MECECNEDGERPEERDGAKMRERDGMRERASGKKERFLKREAARKGLEREKDRQIERVKARTRG